MSIVMTRRNALKASLCAGLVPNVVACGSDARKSWIPNAGMIDLIEESLAAHKVPGAGIAVLENGDRVWEKGFGVANLDTRQPVTDTSLFQAASLSKPVFVYVVMQAVDRGEISLDDRLVEYDRPVDLADHAWVEQITVRHVLQHATGLPNWRDDENGPDILTPEFEPGTGHSYSGEAFHWLQRVMEANTGLGLPELIRQSLFEPAGLSDMSMTWTPARDAREVYGHVLDEHDKLVVDNVQYTREFGTRLQEVAERWGRPMTQWTADDHTRAAKEMRPHTHPRLKERATWKWQRPGAFIIDSASSLRTTPGDYARFLTLMMPGRTRADWEISDATRRLMLTPQNQHDGAKSHLLNGLGWGLERRDTGIVYNHWGKNGASHISAALGDPELGKGIVVMTNGSKGTPFIEGIVPKLTGIAYRCIID